MSETTELKRLDKKEVSLIKNYHERDNVTKLIEQGSKGYCLVKNGVVTSYLLFESKPLIYEIHLFKFNDSDVDKIKDVVFIFNDKYKKDIVIHLNEKDDKNYKVLSTLMSLGFSQKLISQDVWECILNG